MRIYQKNLKLVLAVTLTLLTLLPIGSVAVAHADEAPVWCFDVPSEGTPVCSPVLMKGRYYRIVASEMFWYDVDARLAADAQYYTTDPSDYWNWGDHFPAPDGHSFLQIDGKDVKWGPFSNGDTEHTYSIVYRGEGKALCFKIVDWIDEDYENNGCHLPVCICEVPCVEPRTPGYWKNHPDYWPVEEIEIGGATYSKEEALAILWSANAKDATCMLAAQLIAAKLNVHNGACAPCDVLKAIYKADEFLMDHPIGSNPRGWCRDYALMLKDVLDHFNNGY